MILARNVTKTYKGNKDSVSALDGVDFSVPRGKIMGLLGPNGAGKTTFIRLLCGLLLPDKGEVAVDGYGTEKHREQVARLVGCLLEGTRNVYLYLTVQDNLLYFGRLCGIRSRELLERIDHLLGLLGLAEKRKEYVFALSRGMQQKLALAVALLKDPPYLLLDEPTLGLDVETTIKLKDYLRTLRDQGKGIVLTTHQLGVAEDLSDELVFIRCGQIIGRGTKASIAAGLSLVRNTLACRISADSLDSVRDIIKESMLRCEFRSGSVDIYCESQRQLESILGRCPVLSITSSEPTLEEVFVALMASDKVSYS